MTLNLRNWIASVTLAGIALVSANIALAGKDAPPPKAPPKDWRKYIFEDIKAPTPRPKQTTVNGAMGLKGSSTPVAKDAPKPTDPPDKWRKYIFEDIKAPKPRPKPSLGGQSFGMKGSSNSTAKKDAPDPKDPPGKWRKYVFEDIKAPTPRPKGTNSVPLDPVKALKRPDKIGFPPPQQSMQKFPPKNPPYTHPPRDLKGPKGPKGPVR